jgi:hypothetical protein
MVLKSTPMKNAKLKIVLSLFLVLLFNSSILSQGSCWPDQSDGYWKINEALYGSKKLSACDINAYYNCHGFMMSYFEDSPCSKPGWTNPVPAPYTCPNSHGVLSSTVWQNSGRYVQVGSESNAKLVYYVFPDLSDHSAVKETIPGGQIRYISKYNYDGPLVEHKIDSSWYHLSGQYNPANITRQFWTYVGYISGSTNIVGTNPVNYSVDNNATVNYSWSITSGYQNIYISSSPYQNNVTLAPTHSGTAVLQLIMTSTCSSTPRTQQISLNITTNVCLEGSYDHGGVYYINLNTVNHVTTGGVYIRVSCPNSTTVTWQKTSGNIDGYFPNGYTASFNMTSGGSITLLLTAKNGSTTLATRSITFYN